AEPAAAAALGQDVGRGEAAGDRPRAAAPGRRAPRPGARHLLPGVHRRRLRHRGHHRRHRRILRVMTTYRRISADCHIDMPWIPDDLFTANATAAMKDRMPYVVEGPDGPQWTCKAGTSFGLVGGVGPSGQKLVPGQNYRVDKMAAVGLYED